MKLAALENYFLVKVEENMTNILEFYSFDDKINGNASFRNWDDARFSTKIFFSIYLFLLSTLKVITSDHVKSNKINHILDHLKDQKVLTYFS